MRPQPAQTSPLEKPVRWLVTGLLAAAFLIVLAGAWPESGWPMAALMLLVTLATVIQLMRQLPLQNVLLAMLVIGGAGGAISALGASTGIPFGQFFYLPEAGPQLFKTLPWAIPLLWIVAVLNSRGVARLILRPWRKTRTYGFWLMGMTSGLVIAFDFVIEPFAAVCRHYWVWAPTTFPFAWQGAPLVNFFSWGMVTLLMLAFITPALINKQLSKRSTPDFHPLGLWLGMVVLAGVAAAQQQLWPVVIADAAIGIIVATLAIRGGRW